MPPWPQELKKSLAWIGLKEKERKKEENKLKNNLKINKTEVRIKISK